MTKKNIKVKIMIGDNMKSKEKGKKYVRFTVKNIVILLVFVFFSIYLFTFYEMYFQKQIYAKEISLEQKENIKISNAKKINMDEILSQNIKLIKKEEYSTQEMELEYITKYITNENLPKGTIQVVQEGRTGKQEITIKKTYENEELKSEEQAGAKVIKASINKIVEVGGGKGKSNYKVKVGDTLYVTSDRLTVRFEPVDTSEKLATLTKNDEVQVTGIQDDWYQIKSGTTRGYVKAESTTYINPYKKYEEEAENEIGLTKANLSFDMKLNKPSGLSLEQFKKILSDDKDKNKVFENNSEYFYYIEKQYNINGVFVAAIGIHESAWGTSKISRDKNNLFGYGAYDSNPYNGAYSFSDYSEGIDLIARVLVKYYLNPKGTKIYEGESAVGSYYSSSTLSGVNNKYATDKNWANGVYSYMKYLYNKL